MRLSVNERVKIWNNFKKLYANDELFEEKTIEIFKYTKYTKDREEGLQNTDIFFTKINDIIFLVDTHEINNNDTSKILQICFDTLIEYQYFKYHLELKNIKDEAHYKYKQLKQKLIELKPFILNSNDLKIKFPKLPNIVYSDAYYLIHKKLGIEKGLTLEVLNILFDKEKKAKVPKEYKRERNKIIDTLQRILDSVKSENKHDSETINYHQNKIDEQKKAFD